MELHSSYLQPQSEIDDPLKELTKKPFYVSEQETFRSALNETLPDGWDDFIHTLKKDDFTISETQLQKIQNSATYKWTFKDNHIIINVNTSKPLSEKDFEIDTTSIRSDIISGDFLYPILNSSITIEPEENKLNIILTPNTENSKCSSDNDWPVLISGGDNIDSFSSFLLADVSMRSNQIDFFFYWGIKSASNGCNLAQKSVGIMYLTLKDFNKSMYWFTNLSLSNKDEFARTVLAQFLFEAQDENFDPRLSENILVILARERVKEAFYYLGYLHLQKLDNWNNDEKLAVKYLEIAAKQGDKPSLQLLAECYSNGVGCEKDIQKGMMYSKMADDDAENEVTGSVQNNINDENNNNNNNIKNDEDSQFPIASVVVSAFALVGTAIMGRYIFRKVFRK